MPNAFAHYLTAQRALARCADEDLRAIIARHRPAFNLGAQGPDLFYFYRAWPWTPSQRLAWLGDALHRRALRRFYNVACTSIRQMETPEREAATAYLAGYTNHHALDATVHPYVIYRTGDFTQGGTAGHRASRRHGRMEVAMDALLLRQETGQNPAWLIDQGLFAIPERDATAIATFYEAVTPAVHGRPLRAAQVLHAINDAQRISSFLFDAGPSPRWALVRAVAALDSSGRVHSARYRRVTVDDADLFNNGRAPWFLPWDGSEPQRTSFPDMIDLAASSAAHAMAALAAAIRGGRAPDAGALDNRSFDTGQDSDDSRPLHVFAPGME